MGFKESPQLPVMDKTKSTPMFFDSDQENLSDSSSESETAKNTNQGHHHHHLKP